MLEVLAVEPALMHQVNVILMDHPKSVNGHVTWTWGEGRDLDQ